MPTQHCSVLPASLRLSSWGVLSILALPFLSGCAGGGTTSGPVVAPTRTAESVWEALNQPRPEPLPGATRISVSEVILLGDPWGIEGAVPAALGIQELVSAGLLRRRDVVFVERRRFSEAAEMERRGQTRPRGSPPVGVSPGAELVLAGSWAQASADSAYLDFRLTRAETGEVVTTFRRSTPIGADPTALARSITAGLLKALDEMGRLPAWKDPIPDGTPEAYQASGVSLGAVAAFFAGIAAEDRYDWEGAREAYQSAVDQGGSGFLEADAALFRIARLRSGGTLGLGIPH